MFNTILVQIWSIYYNTYCLLWKATVSRISRYSIHRLQLIIIWIKCRGAVHCRLYPLTRYYTKYITICGKLNKFSKVVKYDKLISNAFLIFFIKGVHLLNNIIVSSWKNNTYFYLLYYETNNCNYYLIYELQCIIVLKKKYSPTCARGKKNCQGALFRIKHIIKKLVHHFDRLKSQIPMNIMFFNNQISRNQFLRDYFKIY